MNDSNNNNKINIYQFSTGIDAVINPDGTWYSNKFTGQYMNCTIDSIPSSVQTAISNDLFKVAEGKTSNQPAIIGRVVPGNPDWSVVAIITSGIDNKSRTIPVTRYFLSEGSQSLWTILSFILNYRDKSNKFPVFDPSKQVTQAIKWDRQSPQQITPEETSKLRIWQTPYVFCNTDKDKYELHSIHRWAEKKAELVNRPISWAYNVQALAKPESFIVIHTADNLAYQNVENDLAQKKIEQQKVDTLVYRENIDEKSIDHAIEDLINTNNINLESKPSINIIADNLPQKGYDLEAWEALWEKRL